MVNPIHHIHKRKRVHVKLEPYPHKHPGVRFLDRFLLIVAIVGPLVLLPQIIKIFGTKNATGVSMLTFALYAVVDIPWIIYGVVHKEKPIVIAYSMWLVLNLVVVAGTLMYS